MVSNKESECVPLLFPGSLDLSSIAHLFGLSSHARGLVFRLLLCSGCLSKSSQVGSV